MKTIAISACVVVSIISMILLIALLSTSVRTIKPAQFGVRYNSIWKEFDEDIYFEGRYVVKPASRYFIFNTTNNINEFASATDTSIVGVSKDGLIVKMDIIVQWKIDSKGAINLLYTMKDIPELFKLMDSMITDVSIEVASQYEVEEGFMKKREDVAISISQGLTQRLKKTGLSLTVDYVGLTNYEYSDDYSDAVTDKQYAFDKIQLLKNQRPVLLANANRTLVDANNQATIELEQAIITAEGIVQASVNLAEGRLESWLQYANSHKNTWTNLNISMTPEEYVDSYMISTPLFNDNKNKLYVKID